MPVTVPGDTTPLITLPGNPRSAAGAGSRQGAPVQLVFGPEDLEAYAVVRDRLRLHIVAWARRRGLTVEPSLVAAALDHKHSVDGRLGHWTRTHVADALKDMAAGLEGYGTIVTDLYRHAHEIDLTTKDSIDKTAAAADACVAPSFAAPSTCQLPGSSAEGD